MLTDTTTDTSVLTYNPFRTEAASPTEYSLLSDLAAHPLETALVALGVCAVLGLAVAARTLWARHKRWERTVKVIAGEKVH